MMENWTELVELLDNTTSPPCARAMLRAIAKPSPVPEVLVVKKGSNMRSTVSGGIGPLLFSISMVIRESD